jgi:phytoene synthase
MGSSLYQTAADYCRKLTTKSQSNFYYAFFFLSPRRRQALEAVYAFCRLVDDVVDEPAADADKHAGLAAWRADVEKMYGAGEPTHIVAQRLKSALDDFAFQKDDLLAIIDGCEMDIAKHRYESWDELRLYCYRVASAVGLLCIEIFGYLTPAAREYAINLGIALQLTNILREVAEDAGRGRIYLPAEDLRLFGVTEADLQSGVASDNFRRLMTFEAQRARTHYLRARAAIGADEKRKLFVAEIMGDVYYRLLCELEARQFEIFGAKTKLSRSTKLVIALKKFVGAQLLRA